MSDWHGPSALGFVAIWGILFVGGIGWDMGKGLSRTIRLALIRWWRRRRARRLSGRARP